MNTWDSLVEKRRAEIPTWAEVRASRQEERRYPHCPIPDEKLIAKIRRLPHRLKDASSLRAHLRWKRERMQKGWSEYDWWSIDHHFALMIAETCRKYRDEGHGYPHQFAKDGKPLAEVFAVEKWNTILTEIADGFQNYHDEKITTEDPQFKRAMKLFSKWFGALWD